MNQEHGPISDDPAQFRTTCWSVILAAAESKMPGSRAALAELCQNYWYPLYAFARRCGYTPADAQDLTQGFFLHLLEHRALKRVDPVKGKFRSFLLASFRNFLADEGDKARALNRKQYASLLRQEIGRTVSGPEEIDEEIRALCDALVVAEGRI
jgi:DNA-directed RNA polymerase specialized sigma24 family protein